MSYGTFPQRSLLISLRNLNFSVKIELGEYGVFIKIFVLKPVLKVIFFLKWVIVFKITKTVF